MKEISLKEEIQYGMLGSLTIAHCDEGLLSAQLLALLSTL